MEYLVVLLLLSTISAFVGFGFNRMQDPDMIFNWYSNWLDYLAGNRFMTLSYRWFLFKTIWNYHQFWGKLFKFNRRKDKWYTNVNSQPIKKSRFLYYLTKPLGRCILCNTAWIGIIITLILTTNWTWMVLFDCIIVATSSVGIVTLIINKFNQLQRKE